MHPVGCFIRSFSRRTVTGT